MRKHHMLKILPIYYDLVREGRKTFEVRKNDRGFQNADRVTLQEWENDVYTGRELSFSIGYVLDMGKFNPGSDLVVFSLLEEPL